MPPAGMIDEKRIKAKFKTKARENPEKYYPVQLLKDEGFERFLCKRCGTAYWSISSREVCGEPECSGGYTFIGDSPAKKKMDFIETWKEFSKLFKSLDYTPIKRYPVAARWRDDTDFVQASIYDFQPYVVSGDIEPPANPLVVPQFCLRFNDIDNVGYTGRHYTGFVMIGQHAFEPPERYAPPDYLRHIYTWLVKGMGVPKEEIQFHEDTWAGGGNMGPSMEFFSRGLEIGNQVYMQYDIRSGTPKELAIKVLDMGMGQERPAWFTHGTATSYEANFGDAIRNLYRTTGTKPNQDIVEKFLPYSGMLNFDEVEDIEKIWNLIASKIGVELKTLKEEIVPLADLYSVADHTRSLLVALTDGVLPSNVGGGYNLRTLLRRSLDILSHYSWDVELIDVCSWHANYLKPQFPELAENLREVTEILDIERKRHHQTAVNSKRIVASLKSDTSLDKLVTLYDSRGVTPQMLIDAGLEVNVPSDFYAQVAQRHDFSTHAGKTKKNMDLDLSGLSSTKILYYDDYQLLTFKAKVQRIIADKYVILDKSAFYPTSGGQLHDIGTLNSCNVLEVFKQRNVVIHKVKSPTFKVGNVISGEIDKNRRVQLAQHHTATHIVNGVSRELLGEHIWQAGAEKSEEKARLDITHYESLSADKLLKIERKANEIITKGLVVNSNIMKRDLAESKYGFRLYQGGAVPGKDLRIVSIKGLDVEACGGTHLKNTSEVGMIKMLGSSKIQDGIVRLEFTAGAAALETVKMMFHLTTMVASSLINSNLFQSKNKELSRLNSRIFNKILPSIHKSHIPNIRDVEEIDGELKACSNVFSVSSGQLSATIDRFIHEVKELGEMSSKPSDDFVIPSDDNIHLLSTLCQVLFETWKSKRKLREQTKVEDAKKSVESLDAETIGGYEVIVKELSGGRDATLVATKELSGARRIVVIFGISDTVSIVASSGSRMVDAGALVKEVSALLGGGGGGKPDFGQGAGKDIKKVGKALDWARKNILYNLREV